MHDRLGRVSDYPSQTVGGRTYPAVQFRGDNGTFIVMFDPQTKLPAIVRTRDFDQFMGDVEFRRDVHRLAGREWREVPVPHHLHAERAEGLGHDDQLDAR